MAITNGITRYSKQELDTMRELLTLNYPSFFRLYESETGKLSVDTDSYCVLADYLEKLAEYAIQSNDVNALLDYFRLTLQWNDFSQDSYSFHNSITYTDFLTFISSNLLLSDPQFRDTITSSFNLKMLIDLAYRNESTHNKNPTHIEFREFILNTLIDSYNETNAIIKYAEVRYVLFKTNDVATPDSAISDTKESQPDNQTAALHAEFEQKYIRQGNYSQHQIVRGELGEGTKLDAYREKIDFFKSKGHQALLFSDNDPAMMLNNIQNNLDLKFPHFSEITHSLCASIAILICAKEQRPIHFKPTLLVGAPGMGKTTYLQYFSELLTLPFYRIDVGNMTSGFVLNGSDTTWSAGKPGKIAKHVMDYGISNPIFLLDEVDKASRDPRANIEDSLLPLLEENTAKEFNDEFLNGLRLDITGFTFFATANDTAIMSDALLSRFQVLDIREPNYAELRVLVQQIYNTILTEHGISTLFEDALTSDFIDSTIKNSNNSLREINRYLTQLISQVALQHIHNPVKHATNFKLLSLSQCKTKSAILKKNPIGFNY
jgi:MoxR-like ATPase